MGGSIGWAALYVKAMLELFDNISLTYKTDNVKYLSLF